MGGLKCSICTWLGPCLSVRLREVSVSGGSTVSIGHCMKLRKFVLGLKY